MDDAFIDDSVASNVKASLQKCNKVDATRNLFVVRSATHLLDQVIQVGLDELDRIMEKSAKCPRYEKGSNQLAVQYPNGRYAPSPKDWRTANKICEILKQFQEYIDWMPNFPSATDLFDTVKRVYREADSESRYVTDDAFSKIKRKFKERWKFCFLHVCMPMVMDPKCSLECIKFFVQDNEKYDYMHEVCDTFVNLFKEYSDQVDDPNCTSGSKARKGTVEDADTLSKYYHDSKHQSNTCKTRPAFDEASVLQWWKEHSLNYPTIARMARDILALPCNTDCKVAKRTAGFTMCELAVESCIEMLVCTQDWLTPAGTEDVHENANNGIDEEDSIGNPTVWDVFIPTFVDGKVARAECMLCHRVFNYCSTNGTSSLLRHHATCRSRTSKRPRHQGLTSLPSIQNTLVASGSDPKQKKLSFLPSSQKKCLSTADASPEQKQLALPDTYTDTKRKNQEVDQNGSHEELVVPEEIVASPIVSTENNKCHGEIPSPGQKPIDTSHTNQKAD
ncbi:LOW QUALITY PROTEIN: hypothetical protein U9M48_014301 [Paspalum notatum var. saurae]|uniref:BED-type domain-containing protein n=1 Tax=Paspalum notatum var. saurae TaxID=547442 RepID=A0AAQ3T3Z1_PASNO